MVKGQTAAKTKFLREAMALTLADEAHVLKKRLREIDDPKAYIDAYCKLAKFVLPGLQIVQLKEDSGVTSARAALLQKLNESIR